MDQEKIGRFIASCRKEKQLTQATLAEQPGITDRAVSKWENGKSMPDISIMLDLCSLLELTKLEEINNKRLLAYEKVIGGSSTVTFMILVYAASFAVTSNGWRIAMMFIGATIFVVGMVACLRIEHDAGYYECPNCGWKYIPTMKAVVLAPHMGLSRRMKCPHCEKRGYHKKGRERFPALF